MSVFRPSASTRRQHRRAPRPLTAALVELLRAHRPPTTDESDVWICLTPATASAIARIAARREGSLARYETPDNLAPCTNVCPLTMMLGHEG